MMLFDGFKSIGGNPTQRVPYQVAGNDIFVKRDGKWTKEFTIKGDSLVSLTGGVLTRRAN